MEQQQTQREMQRVQQQETERQSIPRKLTQRMGYALLTQAILAGQSIWDLPREGLEDLARQVGNSGMIALSGMYGPQPVLADVSDVTWEGDTSPFPVPEALRCETVTPPLLVGAWPNQASDPAVLN